jgi:hypothetical protein
MDAKRIFTAFILSVLFAGSSALMGLSLFKIAQHIRARFQPEPSAILFNTHPAPMTGFTFDPERGLTLIESNEVVLNINLDGMVVPSSKVRPEQAAKVLFDQIAAVHDSCLKR